MGIAVILGHTTTWVFLVWGGATAGLLSAFSIPSLGSRLAGLLRWQRPRPSLGQAEPAA
jgi:hypothetical protein